MMDKLKASAPQLQGVSPYDPKYLKADVLLSANENPNDIPADIKRNILSDMESLDFNRYPSPLADQLRDAIAKLNGVQPDSVLVGNGGDELLFDIALAWGGPGRTMLNFPPTFSVYGYNAMLTNTEVMECPRLADRGFAIDEPCALGLAREGSFSYTIITSPNNPTGNTVSRRFVEEMLDATDALIVLDEAYSEFSRESTVDLVAHHKNLAVLRTFSKAYSLAGARVGYLIASPEAILELQKVRQPYSVDAISQLVALRIVESSDAFLGGIDAIIGERERIQQALVQMEGIKHHPSKANWVLVSFADAETAEAAWDHLYSDSVLVRDFSHAKGLEGTLRVSIGTKEQNDRFLDSLKAFLGKA